MSMKILHIAAYYIRATKSGGPALVIDQLARALEHEGHQNHVVTSTGNLDAEINLPFTSGEVDVDERGISTTYLRRNSTILPPTFYNTPNLENWLEKHIREYDIVIVHGMWTYFSWRGARICQKHKVPYLVFIHGSLDPWALKHHGSKKIPYWWLIEKPNLEKASGIIVLSEDEAQQVRSMKIDRSIFQARNGLLFPITKMEDSSGEISRNLPEISKHPFVCFISRLHPKKGLEILVKAWRSIIFQYPEWRLVIAGPDEGGYLSRLQELVKANGLEETVCFPGLVQGDFKTALLQEASIFTLPSYSEGVPGSVVEALAYGKPVVITPGCHMPEVAKNNAGLIVEPEATSLARALGELISNEQLREQMGRNAEILAREQFDELKVAEGLVDFCQEILAKKKKAS